MRKARQTEIHEEETGEERGGTRAMQYAKPNQPNRKVLPKQVFQRADIDIACYDKYPWPHFILATGGVLVFSLLKRLQDRETSTSQEYQPCFCQCCISKLGEKKHLKFFVPWHEQSEGHKAAGATATYETRPITTQLSSAGSTQWEENRASLLKIRGAEMFLLRQGVGVVLVSVGMLLFFIV